MKIRKITTGLVALALMGSLQFANVAVNLSKETKEYRQFVIEQFDLLLADTEKFVKALKSGDVKDAKAIYPLARMYY